MDNGAFSSDNPNELMDAFENLNSIFNPYGFTVQQLTTNYAELQNNIDIAEGEATPKVVKLLGAQWDRLEHKLFTRPINLNIEANTKRLILQSIASQYDVHNFNGPILNRSRLFLHKLQCSKDLKWDDKLSKESLNEWRNIVKQANASPPMQIDRSVGSRADKYCLIACTDASREMYGMVLYMRNITTGKSSFLLAKNRIVNSKLATKTIPSLEMQGILLGAQTLIDTYLQLSGPTCVDPVNIVNLVIF